MKALNPRYNVIFDIALASASIRRKAAPKADGMREDLVSGLPRMRSTLLIFATQSSESLQ